MGRKKKRDAYEVLAEHINDIKDRYVKMPSKQWVAFTKCAWDRIPPEYRPLVSGPDDIWKNHFLTLYLGWADLWQIPGVDWELQKGKNSEPLPYLVPVFDPKIYY